MIQLLSQKFRTTIALFIATVFYCNGVLAAYDQVIFYSSFKEVSYPEKSNNYKSPGNQTGSIQKKQDKAIPALYRIPSQTRPVAVIKDGTGRQLFSNEGSISDIGGPSQPESSSFQSVNSNNMVDLFSGDFSYNIPLLDVGGYPVNMFYRSGITMDQEASWVGLGWNINPGAITRNMRGLPDDFDGGNDKITKTSKIKDNNTTGATFGTEWELIGFPQVIGQQGEGLNLGLNAGVFYNNYKGWGLETGLNASIASGVAGKGKMSAGLSITNNTQEGISISPSLSVSLDSKDKDDNAGNSTFSTSLGYNTRSGLRSLQVSAYSNQSRNDNKAEFFTLSSSISFSNPAYTPTISIPYTSRQISFTGKIGGEKFAAHLPDLSFSAYGSTNYIADEDTSATIPAFGYLHFQSGSKDPSSLLDYNREKEIPYREKPAIPNLGIPSYTYDVFSISGEGSGGSFRAYRSDIGSVYDHYMTTKSESGALSLDLGIGNTLHVGVDVNVNSSVTQSGPWATNNTLKDFAGFQSSDSVFEAVYFRNPGEKTINDKAFYNNLGGDDVVTPELAQIGSSIIVTNKLKKYRNKKFTNEYDTITASTGHKMQRDKRSQVISYLNAGEASEVGLSKTIENYPLNTWIESCVTLSGDNPNLIKKEERVNSFRQKNHLSEIDVLNSDGRRYIYGLPVYNLTEKDVTYSIDHAKGNALSGLALFNGNDQYTTSNAATGRDNYYNSEVIPAYAHSFLLTSIVSPDYVDVTGNGISDDDLGDGIKFNYTKVAGIGTGVSPYKWRAPFVQDSLTFNEGLRTDNRDDRGSYVYGEKELWFLNSVESKNMLAVFIVESRSDQYPMGIDGKKISTNPSKRLKEIKLYTKADFLKNRDSAKAIKTVHFAYSYNLCKGVNTGINNDGKLTLDSVWFTYNGSTKRQNIYRFHYSAKNPDYNTKSYDRWGNFKEPLQNPRSVTGNIISNAEYPYALQDSTLAAVNAAAWTLDSVKLPSGGAIKVTYESDDYAYVQNKRAGQMFNIVSLGKDSNYSFNPKLYSSATIESYKYVFIRVPDAVASKQDIFTKYLDGIEKIFFRLSVQMPPDSYGSGYEYVPTYASLDISSGSNNAYGIVTGTNNKLIWIKIKGINVQATGEGPYTTLSKAAITFLRLNLPSKAYPGSEVGDKISLTDAVNMLFSQVTNITNAFSNFDVNAMHNGWANLIDTNRSLVRLNNPVFKKYGGGQRVKKLEIYDNWKKMTNDPGTNNNGQKQSIYGQEYNYTTIKEINGVSSTISSGVASYEPMIGGEENPWRQPLEYTEQVAPLAPTSVGYTELPLCEGLFPGASVGYSQVRVRSVNTQNTKSANGYEETKFYTTYDFPVITDFTPLEDNKKRYKPAISNFLRINAKNYIGISQGFKIELNDMNGKVRSQATYPENDPMHPVSYTENFYKVDDNNPVFKHLSNTVAVVNSSGEVDTTAIIGKDVELMSDLREQYSESFGANVQFNVDIFISFALPVVIPSIWIMPQSEENLFHSAAMTKVIQRYGILDSIVAIDKGSRVSTRNMLYDGETGDVLLTRTQNEFNDPIYNFTYPAHWAYSGMGPAYKNVGAQFTGIAITHGIIQSNSRYPGLTGYFESGDEILCASATDSIVIWAVHTKKINSANTAIYFMDRNGNPVNGTGLNLKIIRSGKRNIAGSPAGSVTCLKNPVQVVSSVLKVVLDSTSEIINAGTAVYNDFWKVKDSYYEKDTVLTYETTLAPETIIKKRDLSYTSGSTTTSDNQYWESNPTSVGAGELDYGSGYCSDVTNIKSNYKTILNFNFSSIPSGATINSGTAMTFTAKHDGGNFYSTTCINQSPNGTSYYGPWGGGGKMSPIISAWTNTTPYTSFTLGTVVSIFYGNSTDTVMANCVDLVQSIMNMSPSSRYGIMFERKAISILSSSQPYDYLSFCANNSGGCTAPSLKVNYSIHTTLCKSSITQANVNPYVSGIYGNWRPDKSIVYYGDRRQTDPLVNVNIRKDGAIRNYIPFWSFTSGYLSPTTDTSNWVWNAQTTLFSRKGFELENKDPLGRYNAGQYGYNETMPVSVTQNSRYREQFSDGFEDYDYDNLGCTPYCKAQRFEDFTKLDVFAPTDLESHTGRFSFKIPENNTKGLFAFPVLSAEAAPSLNKLDSAIRGDSSLLVLNFALAPSGRYWISGWVKDNDTNCLCQSYTRDTIQLIAYLSNGDSSIIRIKTSGNIIEEWQRFEQDFTLPSNTTKVLFKMYHSNGISYLDDIRIQPYNANMKSFVYDPVNLRLMAELDENNYATFYEYDDEGTLVRVKKETKRGIMTIKESRSYLSGNQ